MPFLPLRVSCPGPVLGLLSVGAGWPGLCVSLPGSGSFIPSGSGRCIRRGLAPRGGVRGGEEGWWAVEGGGSWPVPCVSPSGGLVVFRLQGRGTGGRGVGSLAMRREVTRPSFCFPCTGTKAGFHCVTYP